MEHEAAYQSKYHAFQEQAINFAYHGNLHALRKMINGGVVDLTYRDQEGNSALHVACMTQEVVDWSLVVESNRMQNRLTRSRQVDTIQMLLDYGFSLFDKNNDGLLPIQLAVHTDSVSVLYQKYGMEDVLDFLQRKMAEVEKERLLQTPVQSSSRSRRL